MLTVLILILSYSPALRAYNRSELMPGSDLTIRISNVAQFIAAIEKSNFGKLWNSNEMKPFINNQSLADVLKETLLATLLGEKKSNKQLAHLTWQQLQLNNNEFIIGFSFGDKVDLSLTAGMDEAAYLEDKKLDDRIVELDDDLSERRKQIFNGTDIYVAELKAPDGTSDSIYSSFYGGTFVQSSDLEKVEKCIVKLKSQLPEEPATPPTLYIGINNRFISNSLERWLTPPAPAEEDFDEEDEEESAEDSAMMADEKSAVPDPHRAKTILKALGLDLLQGISLELILNPGSADFKLAVDVNGPLSRKGLWSVFSNEKIPRNYRLPYVPEDALAYQVMQLDLNSLWKEIPTMLEAIDPKVAAQFQAYTGMFTAAYQLNLSKDIFENLGTMMTTVTCMDGLKQLDMYVWQLRNSDAIEKFLAKMLGETSPLKAQFQNYLNVYDLQGQKLYCFTTPVRRNPAAPPDQNPDAETPLVTSIAVTGNNLVFGADKMVRDLINAVPAKNMRTLYQTPDYNTLMKQVPDDALAFKITDSAQLMRFLLGFLKNPVIFQGMQNAAAQANQNLTPWQEFLKNLQYRRLPEQEFITSFFGKIVSYFHLEGNSLVSRGSFSYQAVK